MNKLVTGIRDIQSNLKSGAKFATEQATKQWLIVPFIEALGYSMKKIGEVTPEAVADVGYKNGEKVDYKIAVKEFITMGKKVKKVLITTGIITSLALSLVGCSGKEAVETTAPIQTETVEEDLDIRLNIPTTEVDLGDRVVKAKVYESEADGAWSGLTEEGDSIAIMGRYGEYGEEMYNALVDLWKDWTILDEAELRINATAMLGLIAEEDYEAIITEILSLDRGTNPYTPTEQVAQDNSNTGNNNTGNNNQQQPVTQPAPPETQATPQPTQPAETQPAPQQNNDSDLAEGALSLEEVQRREAEAGMGKGEAEVGHVSGWSGPEDFDWQ